ncbi:NAD(P)H-dependent oxidoreductase [Hyphomicrobium sp. D-2]|uniref:NAD(P)H-dependent oxidoreductase n=1 Tax=Hyphomicrobium sp. D-2 TaxID=3041621 RepID=UPI00245553C8|nr:NAD(P)H-dependent oxidoreductase [Hyphomicrobium sp. D-2]MDH4982581.1 NAD(P)H-dependent oxidoreductase [Hyphomicrobium sp. D-2]
MPSADLLVTCHPSEQSLCGQVARMVTQTLQAQGRDVLSDDLNQTYFNPVISPAEYANFFRDEIPTDLTDLAEHLSQAERVIFILPVWMYDMPALLKGYFERVWRPGIAYRIAGDQISPLLTHIREMIVIVTHGRNEEETDACGDATRTFFATSLPTLLPNLQSNIRFDFYALDTPDKAAITDQLEAIRKHLTIGGKGVA